MICVNNLEIIVSYVRDCYGRCAVSSFLVIACSLMSGARFKLHFHIDSTEVSRSISKALYLVHSPVYGKRERSSRIGIGLFAISL